MQIEIAFRPAVGRGWREAALLAPVMEELSERGSRQLGQGEVEAALVTFATVASGILKRIGDITEDESELGINVDHCVRGLAECLERADARLRPAVIDAILRPRSRGAGGGLPRRARSCSRLGPPGRSAHTSRRASRFGPGSAGSQRDFVAMSRPRIGSPLAGQRETTARSSTSSFACTDPSGPLGSWRTPKTTPSWSWWASSPMTAIRIMPTRCSEGGWTRACRRSGSRVFSGSSSAPPTGRPPAMIGTGSRSE